MTTDLKEDKSDHGEPFNKLTRKSAIVTALCVLPLFFLFLYLGDPGRGRAAAVCAFVIATCTRMFYGYLKSVWLWATSAMLICFHGLLVARLSWTSKDYPGVVLLPIALLDFFAVYGMFKLVRAITRRQAR